MTPFDPAPGLIAPDFEQLSLHLPARCLFAFLSEARIERFAREKGGTPLGRFASITKSFPIYEIQTPDGPIALMQAPVGAPAAVLMEERLYAYGAEKILAIGCCGALTDLPENAFLPVMKSFREEGTSFHYQEAGDWIFFDEAPRLRIEAWMKEKGIPFTPAVTWTSDGFFRETKEKIKARRRAGCNVVDMEAAALAACARFHGKEFAQILFTADTLSSLPRSARLGLSRKKRCAGDRACGSPCDVTERVRSALGHEVLSM